MHDNLVRQESHAEVCLISPPFQFSKGPSLALGLLKAVLLREGITCHVDYADIYMLQALGLDCHRILNPGGMMDHLGEYIFCELAGIQPECSLEELTALYRKQGENPEAIELEKIIRSARQAAEEQTEATIQRILRYQPKIVGVTSCFQQRNAAIALCRKLKELRPDIVTVMGGANCFGRAGIAILREFPWVDYVFFGESDDIFAPVCRSILEGSDAPLPYGVLKNGDPLPRLPPTESSWIWIPFLTRIMTSIMNCSFRRWEKSSAAPPAGSRAFRRGWRSSWKPPEGAGGGRRAPAPSAGSMAPPVSSAANPPSGRLTSCGL